MVTIVKIEQRIQTIAPEGLAVSLFGLGRIASLVDQPLRDGRVSTEGGGAVLAITLLEG